MLVGSQPPCQPSSANVRCCGLPYLEVCTLWASSSIRSPPGSEAVTSGGWWSSCISCGSLCRWQCAVQLQLPAVPPTTPALHCMVTILADCLLLWRACRLPGSAQGCRIKVLIYCQVLFNEILVSAASSSTSTLRVKGKARGSLRTYNMIGFTFNKDGLIAKLGGRLRGESKVGSKGSNHHTTKSRIKRWWCMNQSGHAKRWWETVGPRHILKRNENKQGLLMK